jgi:phage baseplate assembly protein W
MPQYVGYSSQKSGKPQTTNATSGTSGGPGGIREPIVWGKKYTLVDSQLVVRDFINALNIRKGSKVGQPSYGSSIWDYVFDPNTADVQFQLENEIKRVARQDSRIILDYVKAFPKDNGILLEIQLAVAPFNQPMILNLYADGTNSTVSQL